MQNCCNIIYSRNVVCFRHIIANNLRKCDNKDNDIIVVVALYGSVYLCQ